MIWMLKVGVHGFVVILFPRFFQALYTAKVKDSQEITVKAIPKVQHAPPASLDWFFNTKMAHISIYRYLCKTSFFDPKISREE